MKKYFLILFFVSILMPYLAFSSPTTLENTLQVAPLRYEEKLTLGDIKDGTIDVMNPTGKDEMIEVEVVSMKMTGVDGQLVFYNDEREYNFEKFITLSEKSFTLPAGEGKKYKFRIGIPIAAVSGGYYGAIFFRLAPSEGSPIKSRAIATGQVGTLFLLEAGQGVVRAGSLDSFKVSGGVFAGKATFEITQSNLAKYEPGVHGMFIKPTGTITVKNIFGKTTHVQKIGDTYILPGTQRVMRKEFDNPYLFGRYVAELSISNYPGDPVTTKTISFFRLSRIVLFVILLLTGVIFIDIYYFMVIRKKKRSKTVGKN